MVYPKDIFAIASAVYLGVMAIPELSMPEVSLSALGPKARDSEQGQFEEELERSIAIAHLTIAFLIIINVGTLPITSAKERPATRIATIFIASCYFAANAFLSYRNSQDPPLGGAGNQFVVAMGIQGAIAALGIFCVMFNSDEAHVEEAHPNAHLSTFPLKNAEAKGLKEERKAQKKED